MEIHHNRSRRQHQKNYQQRAHHNISKPGGRIILIAFLAFLLFNAPAIASEAPPIMKNPLVVQQLRQNMLVDIAKWGMPAVSFLANKQALMDDFQIETGTVVYWSKPFGAEVKLLTPNDTSLYFTTQLELFEGPVTIEIPPVHESGLNFFGTIMNVWQTPLEDVGPKGFDRGKGGKYFITPPNYTGEIPENVIHRESDTYNVVAGFRVTPKSFSDEDLSAAAAYGKTMKITSDTKPETTFFDAAGKPHNPLPPYDADFFRILHELVNTEPMLEHDARFYEMMKLFGMAKDSEFEAIPEMDAALTTMKADLRDYFRRDMGSFMFPGSQWQLPIDMLVEAASQFTYRVGSEYDWKRRALTFHWACWAPKYLGEATFYTVGQFDENGEVLDGNAAYTFTVPADVPVAQFWSVTMYNMNTYAFYDDVHTVALNSLQQNLTVNEDGSTDVYFAPTLPEGVNRGNWVPTGPDSEFFLLFRWYGPTPELFNGEWTMRDLKKQTSMAAQTRETYEGYQTFPDNKEELTAIIRERDLHGATQAYMWTMAWATNYAWMEGNLKVADMGDFVTYVTPYEKRDIITSNMTTPYATAYINLRDFEGGVAEVYIPAGPTAGIINDMQMRLIADTGQVGADQGKGATYLIVGPEGKEPEQHDADFVVHSKTNLLWIGTRVLVDDEEVRNRIFSEYKINEVGKPSTTKVVSIGDTGYRGCNLRGMAHWEEFHWIMQQEPFNEEDAPFLEFLRRVGLEKGKPFNPTERQREILLEAEKKGFAMSVAASVGRLYDEQLKHAQFYAEQDPNNKWTTIMNVDDLENHIDPESGAFELDGRTSYTHEAYSMSKAMRADIVGAGSKYLAAYEDADGDWLNSANSYVLRVPAKVPAELFWSLTGYNGKTRAMVYTDVKEINSRMDIHVNDNGTTDVYLSSMCDKAPFPQNCIDIAGQGDVFVYFRWYSPTQEFFDKSWVLPNIEKVVFDMKDILTHNSHSFDTMELLVCQHVIDGFTLPGFFYPWQG